MSISRPEKGGGVRGLVGVTPAVYVSEANCTNFACLTCPSLGTKAYELRRKGRMQHPPAQAECYGRGV